MIKLKDLIVESTGKKHKIEFQSLKSSGYYNEPLWIEFDVDFTNTYPGIFQFTPSSRKELEKLVKHEQDNGLTKTNVGKIIANHLSRKSKKYQFKFDTNYKGPGYGITIDTMDIINKLA